MNVYIENVLPLNNISYTTPPHLNLYHRCNADEHIVTSSVLSKESITYLQSLDAWESDAMAG